jgi:signal transduction histidine kinase
VTVYLATSISSRLRYREDQVMLLSRQLSRHAEELETAYNELAEMEKAKSAYARKVAHEIRSPLAAIDSLLRVVSDGLVGDIPEQLREMICRSRLRTQELLALVKDLLVLAAARETASGSRRSAVDLGRILDNVVSVLSSQAEVHGIVLKTEVSTALPVVSADQEGMEEVLTNLIGNAIRYSPDGGLVGIEMRQTGPEVEIRISDSGIGIDESDLPRVFDEFYRASNARAFTAEGTGLGLSIVKSIVVAHEGTVDIESRPGKGTTVTVRLPVSAD